MEYNDMLSHLSDEELVEEYALQLTNEADAHEKLLCCEDENFKRNMGAVALRTLVEQGNVINIYDYFDDDHAA